MDAESVHVLRREQVMPAMIENYICQKKCGELLVHASSTCLCDGFVHTCHVLLESIVLYVRALLENRPKI